MPSSQIPAGLYSLTKNDYIVTAFPWHKQVSILQPSSISGLNLFSFA